jgi:hypothetical protein
VLVSGNVDLQIGSVDGPIDWGCAAPLRDLSPTRAMLGSVNGGRTCEGNMAWRREGQPTPAEGRLYTGLTTVIAVRISLSGSLTP